MAMVATVTANAMATAITGPSPGVCVTQFTMQKPASPAGWVTVWAGFIHYHRSHSENTNSQGQWRAMWLT